MAKSKSVLKATRAAQRKQARNKPIRSAVKTYITRAEKVVSRFPGDRRLTGWKLGREGQTGA